jgi:probable O-glycosylation ligase (exosortase A-associated)
MRDYALFGIAAIGLALTLWRPWVGVLLYLWFAYMNPHRLCYGAASTFPFSAVVVCVLLAGLVFSRDRKRLPLAPETFLLILFALWLTVNTFLALNPDGAWPQWNRALKILFMTGILLMMLVSKERINSAVWTIVLSLGYYAVRGGIGSVLTGGRSLVYGPPDTFIADNNDIAVALVTVIPLVVYLLFLVKRRFVRLALIAVLAGAVISVIGTYSRAGLLALAAVAIALLWKSPHRIVALLAVCLAGGLVYQLAPSQWFSRMETIADYDADASAQGRINAWRFAMNVVADRPLTGGGFEVFTPALFQVYAPVPDNYHAAHSIYFKVLGEQGIPGLALYLALWLFTWRTAHKIIRQARDRPDAAWAGWLASMVQVALIGYAVGGAFGNLCYFDLPYHLMALVVGCKVALSRSEDLDIETDAGPNSVAVASSEAF